MKTKNIEDIYALSSMQQFMLLHALASSGADLLIQQLTCTLTGPLEVEHWRDAWREVVSRHAALRTAFGWKGLKKPVQIVRRAVEIPWRFEDLRNTPAETQQENIDQAFQQNRQTPFDLAKGPLMRLALFQTGAERFRFSWTCHHLTLDGWCLPLVLNEVFAAYEALRAGKPPGQIVQPTARSFRDYIAWLLKQDVDQAEAFWREHLAGFSTPVPLPPALPVSPDSHSSEEVYLEQEIAVDANSLNRLRRFAGEHRLTLGALVQAAWGLLLSRYADAKDVVIGVTVSGRPPDLPGVESIVGPFMNNVPLRITTKGTTSVLDWLDRLRRTQIEMQSFEYAPLHQIQSWARYSPPRLFETMLVLENYPLADASGNLPGGLSVREIQGTATTNYPLTLIAIPGQALTLRLRFDGRRFHHAAATRLLSHYRNLLQNLVDRHDQPLDHLPLLCAEERASLLADRFTRCSHASTRRIRLDQVVHNTAKKHPDQIAVEDDEKSLSYRQLEERSACIASLLQDAGLGARDGVGQTAAVCLPPSCDSLAAWLGVWKTGGVVAPLEMTRASLSPIHTKVQLIITNRKLAGLFDSLDAVVVTIEDIPDDPITPFPSSETSPPALRVGTANDIAVVQPGGEASHGALTALIDFFARELELSPQDIACPISTTETGGGVIEHLLASAVGGKTRFGAHRWVERGNRLAETLAQWQATVFHAHPAVYNRLLEAGWNGGEKLKLLVSGDGVTRRLVKDLLPRANQVWRVFSPKANGYWQIGERAAGDGSSVMLGGALPGSRVQILDPLSEPTPIGIAGELAVSRFGEEDSEANSLTPTGRRVRWVDVGRIQDLGRQDAPASLGPARVDPQGVQTFLETHPLVHQAYVAIRHDQRGQPHLVAYIVPVKESKTLLDARDGLGQSTLVLDQLRSHLSRRLADYETPTVYMAVDSLPRNSTGEIDETALPQPTRSRPPSAGPYIAPRNVRETQLAAIWEQVLGVQPIGIRDDFSELGGTSVLAVSLAARVEEQFDRKLPLVSLFQEATIERLAELLERGPSSPEEFSLAPIRPSGEKRPLFCVHPAGGTVFCYVDLARHLANDQPVFGLQAQGIDGTAAPHENAQEMAAHYIKAMQTQQPSGPYLLCGWSSGGILAFEVARQLEELGEEVALLALFDAGVVDPDNPFDEKDVTPMLAMLFPGEDENFLDELEHLEQDQQLAYFRERAELAQLVVAGADVSQARHIFDVFRKNINAVVAYRPQTYGGELTLFRAEEHATPMHNDPHLGWDRWVKSVRVIETPGDHVTMFREPTLAIVAEKLQRCIEEVNAQINAD